MFASPLKPIRILVLTLAVLLAGAQAVYGERPFQEETPTGAMEVEAVLLPRINAPYFTGEIPFEQTAIAWFGRLSPDQNFTDIRVGYNAT
ncbi:MAG: hypothetical protein NZP34_08905, partial [Caldilineales bacterium]|nr:hypothetical protein [Caldilineales bacterium]